MGISESIIALTIVSIGTSAPEFAASVMAAKKGDTAMALGNVVGSVVFNVFYVLGTAATIQPLSAKGITTIDIIILLASSVLLWIFCAFGKKNYTLTRSEGFVFILLMIAYYVYLIINE
jgi:cation:H+ antiporter